MSLRKRDFIEIGLNAPFWIGWIVLIHSGNENGIGYFRQPQHDLLVPLVNGAIFNAATFVANAFWLMPRYLGQRRFGRYAAWMVALFGGVIIAKTLAERLIILTSMPDLIDVSFLQLALENVYVFSAMIVLSTFYRFGRDWAGFSRDSETPDEGDGPPSEDLWIKSGTNVERVPIGEIVFIESVDKYVAFVLRGRRLLTLMTMSHALSLLPSEEFLRIHRSYIVSLRDVRRVAKNQVDVGDVTLPIGKTYRREALSRLAELQDR